MHLYCKRHDVYIGEKRNRMVVCYKAKKFSQPKSAALKESRYYQILLILNMKIAFVQYKYA